MEIEIADADASDRKCYLTGKSVSVWKRLEWTYNKLTVIPIAHNMTKHWKYILEKYYDTFRYDIYNNNKGNRHITP